MLKVIADYLRYLNRRQKDGLADMLDKAALGAIATGLTGVLSDKVTLIASIIAFIVAILSVLSAIFLREDDPDEEK